jgi:hypothetical protein
MAEVVIENGTYMTHGIRMLSRAQYETQRDTLQESIDECARADLTALGIASLFIPKRDGRRDRLLFHPGPMP